MRPSKSHDGGIGDWEKHTKGIASRIMEQMGYEKGKGLGKTFQGIARPVEAFKRKGKAAIGYYGSERTERSLEDYPAQPNSDEEEEKQFRNKLQQWKRPDVRTFVFSEGILNPN